MEDKKIKMPSKLKYELEGREKLLTVFPIINWQFAEDDMCPFDAFSIANGKTILVEIKTRDFPSYMHDDTFLEVDKVFRLNQEKSSENTQIIAVYHFSNNVTATWNLNKLNLKEEDGVMRWMNATTADKTTKVLKKVYLLNFKDADVRDTNTGQKRSRFEPLTPSQARILNLINNARPINN